MKGSFKHLDNAEAMAAIDSTKGANEDFHLLIPDVSEPTEITWCWTIRYVDDEGKEQERAVTQSYWFSPEGSLMDDAEKLAELERLHAEMAEVLNS